MSNRVWVFITAFLSIILLTGCSRSGSDSQDNVSSPSQDESSRIAAAAVTEVGDYPEGIRYLAYQDGCKASAAERCLDRDEVMRFCSYDDLLIDTYQVKTSITIAMNSIGASGISALARNEQFESLDYYFSEPDEKCKIDITLAGIVGGNSVRQSVTLEVLSFIIQNGEPVARILSYDWPD